MWNHVESLTLGKHPSSETALMNSSVATHHDVRPVQGIRRYGGLLLRPSRRGNHNERIVERWGDSDLWSLDWRRSVLTHRREPRNRPPHWHASV
jgi:hypothetical protein